MKSPSTRDQQYLTVEQEKQKATAETQFNFMGTSPVLPPSAKSSITSRSSNAYDLGTRDELQRSPHQQLVKDNLHAKDNSLMRKKRCGWHVLKDASKQFTDHIEKCFSGCSKFLVFLV